MKTIKSDNAVEASRVVLKHKVLGIRIAGIIFFIIAAYFLTFMLTITQGGSLAVNPARQYTYAPYFIGFCMCGAILVLYSLYLKYSGKRVFVNVRIK